jgi:hypothetical protein
VVEPLGKFFLGHRAEIQKMVGLDLAVEIFMCFDRFKPDLEVCWFDDSFYLFENF